MKNTMKKARGFTLIEILVVIGIIAVLAAIVVVAINPARQFAQARDTQRTSNVSTILNAIGQRMADNKGVFAGTVGTGATAKTCPTLSTTATPITSVGTGATAGDLGCLVPTYIPTEIPTEPLGTAGIEYTVAADAQGRVTVSASTQEPSIPRTAAITLTR